MLNNVISNIDIFSTEPSLVYNGKKRIKSLPGMISSTIVITLIFISISYFSCDIPRV